MDNSASKNKSSCPRKGLLGRLAPRATVWTMPSESVHHETMRLVSLSLRLRRRIPRVVTFTRDIKATAPTFVGRPFLVAIDRIGSEESLPYNFWGAQAA